MIVKFGQMNSMCYSLGMPKKFNRPATAHKISAPPKPPMHLLAKHVLERFGCTRQEFANLLGCSYSGVVRLLEGDRDVKTPKSQIEILDLLLRLSNAASVVIGENADLIAQWWTRGGVSLDGIESITPAACAQRLEGLVLMTRKMEAQSRLIANHLEVVNAQRAKTETDGATHE
jgi:hypothetical protein